MLNGEKSETLLFNRISCNNIFILVTMSCVCDTNHIPGIDDSAFAQQKLTPYELWSASPPESLSSSSSDKDSTDNNVDCAGYILMKTGLPVKRVGRGEGELEMEGKQETRGGTEEECPGPSSGTVTKPSGPEPDSEAGHC